MPNDKYASIEDIDISNLSWRAISSGETLIRNHATGGSYVTNSVGSYLWGYIVTGKSIYVALELLIEKFKVDGDRVINDCKAFIKEIVQFCSSTGVAQLGSNSDEVLIETKDEKRISDLWADRPSSVQLDITSMCNFSCLHCYLGELREEKHNLNLHDVKAIIDQLCDLGVYSLGLSGGEVLLRSDICEIVSYARVNGFAVSIATNASELNDEHIKCFKKYGISMINVTVYGSSEATYESMTGVKAYSKVISSLSKLHLAQIPITITIPTCKPVINDYKEIIEIANKFEANIEITYDLLPNLQGDLYPLKLECTNEDLMKIVIEDSTKPGKIQEETPVLCGAARRSFSIGALGDIRPCSVYPQVAGNVKCDKLTDVWGSSDLFRQLRAFRVSDLSCSSCELIKNCSNIPHCYAYSMYMTQTNTKPYSRLCERARLRNEHNRERR